MLDKWSSYTVMTVWELACADSDWSLQASECLIESRFDCTTVPFTHLENSDHALSVLVPVDFT